MNPNGNNTYKDEEELKRCKESPLIFSHKDKSNVSVSLRSADKLEVYILASDILRHSF